MKVNDRKTYHFSTKANTLLLLHDKLRSADVLDMVLFTVEEFINNRISVLERIQNAFSQQTIIVRSSAKAEDGKSGTLAGHFKSVLNVDSRQQDEIVSAINEVISSYTDDEYEKNKLYQQQIFVQRQIQSSEIEISGVAFSFDPHLQVPYFFINYDNSGSTNAVTSGSGKRFIIYLHRNYEKHSYPWAKLVKGLKEIEGIFGCHKIDVEFAILKSGQIIIFQARKLFTKSESLNITSYDRLIQKTVGLIEKSDDIFSDMSFWNPAEMIGREPHPLDYSLYECLITNHAWNEGLSRLGYTLVDSKLMTRIGNHPYISIKKTANALTPQNINNQIRKKIIQYYLAYVKQKPSTHDKLEFEVIYNCAYKGIKDDLKKSFDGVLTDDEINEYYLTLYQLTRDIISHYSSLRSQDLIALESLCSSQIQFKAKISHVSELHELIRFIKEHINSVLTYIAPQFACHARCAFIGKRILMSFVDSGDITSNEVDGFLSHISTIATDLLADMGDKSLSDKVIEKKYGHLRNSTYNILAKKYTDIGINRLRGRNLPASSQEGLVYGNEIFEPIANYFCCSTKEIDEFVVGSIKMRELLKFEYSRSVSLILDAIEIMAQMLLMVTEEIAFVYLDDLLSIKDTFDMGILSSKLKSLSSRNKRRYNKFQELLYPAVITSYYDFFALKIYEDRPNFITTRKVVGDIVFCTERMLDEECETLNLDNRIIVIEKAEPGNDWIFSKYKITGLIAKYGGAASHMAIRCLELGIPAALGCGEKIFRYLSECSRIVLDCKNETISRIL